jgi:2-phospho-L-lactate guanylyltransferase
VTAGFIIPFRGRKIGKARLRARMPAAAVDLLSERMLANVVRAVRGAAPSLPVVVITRARTGLRAPAGVTILEQQLDHNDAIEFARATLAERGVSRVVVVASDLPLIGPADVSALMQAEADVVIAADAQGLGTNALIFPATEAHFSHFGVASARRHVTEAENRKLSIAHVRTAALAHDVDTVDQIDDAVRAACAPAWSRD